ncbi:MAG: 3-hydroxyacyl-ACP dehydratase FabZ [Deltaproteobacteria bacterium]|nr:3-hydroxyacyl-ACP dehydratase FabZ [Deltaproteobacteria bacterium]
MSRRSFALDTASIQRILPHSGPAILIDRVIEFSAGERILATKNMTISDPGFAGHFRGQPIYPAALLIQCMVQSCTVLAYVTEQFDPAAEAVSLVGLNKTKFSRSVAPGDVLEIEAEMTQRRSNVWRFRVKLFVSDREIAESGVVLSIHDRDDTL